MPDTVLAAPGETVRAYVLTNDVVPPGDKVTVSLANGKPVAVSACFRRPTA